MDVLVAAAVAVPVFVPFATAPEVTPLGVVFNLGTVVPLVWRRRAPFATALVVAGFAMGVSLHHRPGQVVQYGALVAIYTLADLGRYSWQRWGFIGALVATIPPGALLVKGNDANEFMFTLLLPITAFLLGTLARTARERSNALVERSAQLEREREALEREREAEAGRAAAEERARIARDMHDVLAHAVSIMVVQAEAGPVVVRPDPDQAERVFDAIAEAGRDAMAQLRRMLGVLKEDQDHGVRAPQPTIGALPGLVEHVDRTQVRVRLAVEGVSRDLPPDADLAVLASEPARYTEYAASVRREYGHLSEAEWLQGRADLVRSLLDRERLFHTPLGHERWEPAARANLEAELAELTRHALLATAE